jgi:hypothetical protein
MGIEALLMKPAEKYSQSLAIQGNGTGGQFSALAIPHEFYKKISIDILGCQVQSFGSQELLKRFQYLLVGRRCHLRPPLVQLQM